MATKVTFHPLARSDLFALYSFIEERSGVSRAGGYLERIEALCGSLGEFPDRGLARDDLGAGIRTIALERRVLTVYRLAADQVVILRVLYAGRDYSAEDVPT